MTSSGLTRKFLGGLFVDKGGEDISALVVPFLFHLGRGGERGGYNRWVWMGIVSGI